MKNGILYIVGAVALLGGGAFLFLKNKKNKDKEKLALAELQTVTAGAETKVQEEVKKVEDVKNLVEATDLAKQIDKLNKSIDNVLSQKTNSLASAQRSGFLANIPSTQRMYELQIVGLKKKIVPLVEKLKDLGYTESYGLPVKIR
jgi:LPXTG-motif cell wall-anchored protein